MEQESHMEVDPALAVDKEIAKIRSEIQTLTNRRRVLSASLLSVDTIRDAVKAHTGSASNPPLAPIVLDTEKHAQTNHHRAIFSATSFPFQDPDPHAKLSNLLGIRIDICTRQGRYNEPYYLLLKRLENQKLLRVHRHTIPAFIPLSQFEDKYLSVPDDEDEHGEVLKPKKQDLKRFVRELRRELVAWHLRQDSVAWIQSKLGLVKTRYDASPSEGHSLAQDIGISSIFASSLEARFVTIEWTDGRVGRIQLSNRGLVEKVAVTNDAGRDQRTERLLLRGDRKIEALAQKLIEASGQTG